MSSSEIARRRRAVEATSREVARLESDRVIAEHAATVARGAAKTLADSKLEQIRGTLSRHQAELEAHIEAIARETDDHIAVVRARAAAAALPAQHGLESLADRLREKRDALVAKAGDLRHAAGGEWLKATAELDMLLQELDSVDGDAQAAGGRNGR